MSTWAVALLLVAGVNLAVLGLAVLWYVHARVAARRHLRRLAAPTPVATLSRLQWSHHAATHQERSRHRPGA